MSRDLQKIAAKEILTTGDVAKLCRCAPKTVAKWVDAGRIKGYRLPGGHGDRRVDRKDLITFMVDNLIPLRELGEVSPKD